MKLVASLIVRNEIGRYLEPCIEHLTEFCDEIRVLDDGSEDGTTAWLKKQIRPGGVALESRPSSEFFAHEGRRRQALLEWTLEANPTHILAIDADEFVTDGAVLREALELADGRTQVWTLDMEEVWELDGDCLCIRWDGGWRPHRVPILYRVPPVRINADWQIADRPLACGREPLAVRKLASRARPSGVEILHFGWANEAERQTRYDRYAVADGGRYHRSAHLNSILWGPDRVLLRGRPWPAELAAHRPAISAAAARGGPEKSPDALGEASGAPFGSTTPSNQEEQEVL